MTIWTSQELNSIGRAGELRVASLRRDGTLRNSVTIWVVRLGDNLYVRSGNGRASAWFRGLRRTMKATFRPAALTKTSPSSRPKMKPVSTTSSTRGTAKNAATLPAP